MSNIIIKDNTSKPYTHLDFKDDPDEFQFAIITDNAGGARPGVFPKAIEMVNSLQPEFVINAGDLIQGYIDDENDIKNQWAEIDEYLKGLEMPFFFVPGNHDLNSPATEKVWKERFGSKKGYYHFVYKNVLFLMINTEDPPKNIDDLKEENLELYNKIATNYPAMEELQSKKNFTSEDAKKLLELADPMEQWLSELRISEEQIKYFSNVLKENKDVRWTFCFMHAPPYFAPGKKDDKDPGDFKKLEALLSDRKYTVFSAHTHTYNYDVRDSHDYITTASTGAISVPRPGAMDHVMWVTMNKKEPKIVNLLMNGILDKKGPAADDSMEEIGLYRPKD